MVKILLPMRGVFLVPLAVTSDVAKCAGSLEGRQKISWYLKGALEAAIKRAILYAVKLNSRIVALLACAFFFLPFPLLFAFSYLRA